MNDPKSTNEIRMIAVDVAARQAEICAARREHLADRVSHNSAAAGENARSIAALTVAMAKQTTAFTSSIDVLKARVTISAAIAAGLPVVVVLMWQWLSNR